MCRREGGTVASYKAHFQKWLGFLDCVADFILQLGVDDVKLVSDIALAIHIGRRLCALKMVNTRKTAQVFLRSVCLVVEVCGLICAAVTSTLLEGFLLDVLGLPR